MVGRYLAKRKWAMEVQSSGWVMDIEAVIIHFSSFSNRWVYMRGEHSGVKGCIVKSADGEGAFVRVRWRLCLFFAM